MAYPDTTPTTSIQATSLLGNNATAAGLPNTNNFDRLTYIEAALANLFTSLPAAGFASAILSSSPTAGVGYTTGAGSSSTQATSKATAFTLNGMCGRITFNNSALAGYATSSGSTWTNSAIAANDIVVFNHRSGGTIGAYTFNCQCNAGSATLVITNVSSASLSEAPVVEFAVIKGAVA